MQQEQGDRKGMEPPAHPPPQLGELSSAASWFSIGAGEFSEAGGAFSIIHGP